ncbi:hypothetical protein ACQPYK_01120 [Streptosporangium sp. CA-135522]
MRPIQGFQTLDQCVQMGTAMLIQNKISDWDCLWDSPYWMLWGE